MPEEDSNQSRKALSRLTVKKLKDLAKKYDIPTADCRKKDDFVEAILKSARLDEVMKEGEFLLREAKSLEALESELLKLRQNLKSTVAEIEAPPSLRDEETDAQLNDKKNIDFTFHDIEDFLEQIRMRFEERNYTRTLDNTMDAMGVIKNKLNELERYLWTYTILSSQKIIEDSMKGGGDVESAARLLMSAKESYKKDNLLDSRALVEDLLKAARSLRETNLAATRKVLMEKEEFVASVKNLGASITTSDEMLQRAWEVFGRDDHLNSRIYAEKAEELAKDARDRRIHEIKAAIPMTQSLIDEAKQLGSDVSEAEKLLKQAVVALNNEYYLLCSELTRRAEQRTVELQDTQIQKAMELRQRQIETISSTIAALEPLVREAEMFGMDAREARELLERAKAALGTQDYVNGTLYMKNVEEIIKGMEADMEKYRRKLEIPKPTSGICANCQSSDLKFFDNGWGKCMSCGNLFKWMVDQKREEEKKGILGKIFKKP